MPKKKSTNIVNIKELVNKKNDQIEEWLRERITEIYGDDDDVNNPILRLITIFDALSDASQKKLYNYAKKMAAEKQGEHSFTFCYDRYRIEDVDRI